MPAPDTTKNIKYAEQISTMFPIQKMQITNYTQTFNTKVLYMEMRCDRIVK